MAPEISVVIPTYNNAPLLKNAIQSVMDQTFQDFEIVVINNYSTDNTEDIVRSFKDNRIKFISLRNEGVIGKSRNRGIMEATAPWVAFLDSDDIWYPKKLEVCLKVLKQNSDIILVCHDEHVVKGGKIIKTNRYGPYIESMYEDLLFKGNRLSTSAVVVKKEKLISVGGFSERSDFVTVEDYDLWMRLAQVGKFYFVHRVLGEYILHGDNYSSNVERQIQNTLNVIDYHLSLYNSEKNKRLVKKRYADSYFIAGWCFYKQGKIDQSIKWYLKAIKEYPLYYRTYIALSFSILRIRWGS